MKGKKSAKFGLVFDFAIAFYTKVCYNKSMGVRFWGIELAIKKDIYDLSSPHKRGEERFFGGFFPESAILLKLCVKKRVTIRIR